MTTETDSVIQEVIRTAHRYKEEGFGYPAAEAMQYMRNTGSNMTTDYIMDDWKGALEDPETQLEWLGDAVDTARQYIEYAAVLMNALGITEEEMLADPFTGNGLFLPSSWDRKTKTSVIEKHIEQTKGSRDMYQGFMENFPESGRWEEYRDREEQELRELEDMLADVQKTG